MKDIDPCFLKSATHIGCYIIIFIIAITLFKKIEKVYRRKKKSLALKEILRKLKWNYVIRFTIITSGPLMLASCVQLRFPSFQNTIGIISYVLASLSIVSLILFMGWSIYTIHMKLIFQNRTYFRDKYGSLTEKYPTLSSTHHIIVRYIIIITVFRRLTFVSSIVLLYDYPLFNLALLSIFSVVLAMITLKYRPYQRKVFNITNVVQEILIVTVNLILIIIKDQSLDSIVKDNLGWTMISLFITIALMNLFFVFKDDIISKYEILQGIWIYMRNCRTLTFKIPKRIYKNVTEIKSDI